MQKILVIDDEQNYLTVIGTLLNDLLPETIVFTAQSGREGVEIAQQELPDVILLDLVMPGMNGYEVCSKLKVEEATKHIPIIMLTAITESKNRVKALDSGADVFLTKPIEEAELIAQISAMLRIKRAEEQLQQEKNVLEELVAERTTELQKEIAERKWIEEMLRENEKRFRTISELVSDYAYVFRVEPNEEFVREWVTEAFTRITGYTHEEVDELGGWIHLIHPEDKDIVIRRHRQTFLSGSESIAEYRIITKDGDVVWLRDYSRPVWDEILGRVVRVFGAAQDITEPKRSEEELRLFKTIVESSQEAIAISTPNGQLVYINPAHEKLFGYPSEEAKRLNYRDYYPSESIEVLNRDVAPVIAGGESWEGVLDVFDVNGRRFPLWERAGSVRNPDGKMLYGFGFMHDDTKHKRAEEELQKAKEAAEVASRAKSEFLANMSHELRTPLNAILGYAQILKNADNLGEHQQEGLDTIKSSGEHLLNLINEILDLSKIEAGCMELQMNEFHLPTLLENIAKIIRVRAEQKGISFVYRSDLNLPEGIRADEKRLREVLINLLSNAVKFTEKGSVTFQVTCQHPPTPLKGGLPFGERRSNSLLEGGRGVLRFLVEDTGIGIAPEKLEDIFLPFQQVGDRRVVAEGTGLGLAISRRLVEMMGGELYVESTIGKGSVFWFDLNLPVVKGVIASAVKPSGKILGYKGEQRTVLVVDDEPANRAILVDRLLSLGFDILEAEDGQKCVEKTLEYKPDLIFLDLRMPVLDGFGATQQIRRTEEIRDVVIIAVSASVFEETQKRALAIGFDGFLIKPFQFEDLLDLLQTHLRLEWIYEEKPEELSEVTPQPYSDSQSASLLPEDLEILLDLASKSRIKPLLQHLSKIETLDETFRPFVEELRQLARHYQSKEIVKRLQQVKERTCRQDTQD